MSENAAKEEKELTDRQKNTRILHIQGLILMGVLVVALYASVGLLVRTYIITYLERTGVLNSGRELSEVLKNEGYKVEERRISVDELEEALESGKLEEAWGCGTAAVVSPIGELNYKDKKFIINNGQIGEVTQHLYDTLTGIQWGKTEDKYGWTYPID